jgi:CheY-like chemotaxis protein
VAIDSEPGRGTTFRLYLPTVTLPVAAHPHSASDAPAAAGTETVMVVEDDDAVRHYTEAVLRAAGYDVLTAANGSEALDLARTTPHPVHLLMSDVVMPVLGGHALAEQFRAVHPEARVLFTSGYTPEAVSRRGVAIPASQFIQKPYAPAALCRKIRSVLDG